MAQSTGHVATLQPEVSSSAPQGLPSKLGLTFTLRRRERIPPPHVVLHVPYAPHCVMTQLIAHGCIPQLRSSKKAGQPFPPMSAGLSSDRVRSCTPPPQWPLHVDHAENDDIRQSMGHIAAEHTRTSCSVGHTCPPRAAWVMMLRTRLCVPLPQVAVHALHAANAETSQCTGHGPSEHGLCSCSGGHTAPPFFVCSTTVRMRKCVPPEPQVEEQSLQAVQGETAQSTGHADVLQLTVACCGPHDLPPSTGSRSILR